ncbi:hypothetical protein [Antrihabitans cavernicola]|uniref:hypothetical protein n=1 Tax=Antrihabitans cavernicola TaxID=2495913 RepID=UPI001F18F49C|nr:hypothetical protein [Spelaeibacter cavernicola]
MSRTSWGGRADRPVGMYTIRDDSTTWTPAIDINRVALIGACTGFVAAALSTAAVLRRPPWPEMTERTMIAIAQARAAESRR